VLVPNTSRSTTPAATKKDAVDQTLSRTRRRSAAPMLSFVISECPFRIKLQDEASFQMRLKKSCDLIGLKKT
jgi:hypothetical protein